MFKNVPPIAEGNNVLLGGISRAESSKKRLCLPLVGRAPILGRLFCRAKKQQNTKVNDGSSREVREETNIDDIFKASKKPNNDGRR